MSNTPPTFAFNALTEPSSNANPSPLPSGFDVDMALILANACNLCYTQYAQGSPLTTEQYQSLNGGGSSYTFSGAATFSASESLGFGAAQVGAGAFTTVPFGFVATASTNNAAVFNVLALRGTQTYAEWLNDIDVVPASFSLVSNNGLVHGGFYNQYTVGTDGTPQSGSNRPAGSLAAQIAALFATGGPLAGSGLPLYVTGHSLGAALAVFAALDIAGNFASNVSSVTMIHFAPPQVSAGFSATIDNFPVTISDTAFANTFQANVAASYAIVNAADIVPILPLTSFSLSQGSFSLSYLPAVSPANTITYCAQLGDIGFNHSLADNYLPYTTELQQGFSS